jgi:hypothetical protein
MWAPSWALGPEFSCNQWAQECRYPPARAHYADWGSIAAELARRYPDAAGIEVWNEPNLSTFWRPSPNPARYTELLAEAYRAIKAVSPSMPVISGGLANPSGVPGVSVRLTDFLRAMYRNGSAAVSDGIGVHPYPNSVDSGPGSWFQTTVNTWRAVRNSFGDSGKPFWATELGMSTSDPDAALRFNEQQQAAGLLSAYRTLAGMSDVKAVVIHELVQNGTASPSNVSGWGLLRPSLAPRPAYCALAGERGLTPCS